MKKGNQTMTSEEHTTLLVNQLKRHMKENKMTQNELAEKSGTSIWTISNAFTGKRGLHFDTYVRIIEALGLDIKLVKAKEDEKLD